MKINEYGAKGFDKFMTMCPTHISEGVHKKMPAWGGGVKQYPSREANQSRPPAKENLSLFNYSVAIPLNSD